MASPQRGEVWYCNLDPTKGHEQAGKRPVLVMSVDDFNSGQADLVVVLPITGTERGIPWHVPIKAGEGGLKKQSFVLVEMVRSVSKSRLANRLGKVSPATLRQVEARLRILMEL
jgi:mRNA interferase MazF